MSDFIAIPRAVVKDKITIFNWYDQIKCTYIFNTNTSIQRKIVSFFSNVLYEAISMSCD
jgi:hypothetical protein